MLRPVHAGDNASWRSYLQAFHGERPGITERVLGRCLDAAGADPYRWVAAAVDPEQSVLDLACGNAPLAALTGPWVGVDVSTAELGAGRARGASPLAVGDASDLPFRDASFDAVVCSMALMLTQPLDRTLGEIARVLRPAGRLVALLPAKRPLHLSDRLHYARLLIALRRTGLGYPNDDVLRDLPRLLQHNGLTQIDDDRRHFACHLSTPDAASELVASLYLPDVEPARIAAADRVARRWAGVTLGVPLRRIVARRAGPRRAPAAP